MIRHVLTIAAFFMAMTVSDTVMAQIPPTDKIIHAVGSLRGAFIDAAKAWESVHPGTFV